MELRHDIAHIDMPRRIAGLPLDHRGYPVPWFVAWIDGKADFRIVGPNKTMKALRESRCWICGGLVFGTRAYVVGPMCAVNRTSAEPPSHVDCARYAAKACPFLARPHMRRRENAMPEGRAEAPGIAIKRNPGVALVWVTGETRTKPDFNGGLLFDLGRPTRCEWYAHGRQAERHEVVESISTGLPILRDMADDEGPAARAELDRMTADAMRLVPAA